MINETDLRHTTAQVCVSLCVLPEVQVGKRLQVEQAVRQRPQTVLVQVQTLQRHEETNLKRKLRQPVTRQICTHTRYRLTRDHAHAHGTG